MPQKEKVEVAQRLFREVVEVVTAKDPVMANREKLALSVLYMAKYLVLVLPSPNDPDEDVTGLRGKPGITGELKAHLNEIAEKDEDISKLAGSLDNATPQNLYDACLVRCAVANFTADVFHRARAALGDCNPSPGKDWYRPFVAAMCAWEEYKYREAIGLPDVLATQDDYESLAALKYSSFYNIVISGAKYPNLEWEERYKRDTA